jgi:hypothetical protein
MNTKCFLSGSTGGTIITVSMENCDPEATDRCQVEKGQTVRGQLSFKASKTTSSLKCELYGIIGGIPLPFPGGCPVVDACTAMTTGSCPIAAGELFVYNMEMFIDSSYPSVSQTLQPQQQHFNLQSLVLFSSFF